ncbi:hypothetical protein QQ045_018093 [Rhodiola kirilowii]
MGAQARLANVVDESDCMMEKICEFCTALRPVVYCKADAAYLCLSCDARVHSANALSGMHFRTLLCQSCRNRPAYVRCVNHEMFICRNCDRTLHGFSSQHQKSQLKTYMGCPSPKDFAVLWGCDMKLLDNFTCGDRFVSSPTDAGDKGVLDLKSPKHFCPKSNGPSAYSSTAAGYSKTSSGLSSQQRKMNQRGDPQQDNYDILQQIIGLKRLQLTEQKHNPSLLRGKEQAEFVSTVFDTSQRLEENLVLDSQHFPDISNDLRAMDISHQGLKEDPCPSPLSQLEQLTSPETVGTLTTDTLWQWRSPVYGSQLWSQNMQDLGFCEDFECFGDIPDVDPTFRNFEDLFGGDQDPTRQLIDIEVVFSAFENTSQDISEEDYAKLLEGASASLSDNMAHPPHQNKAISSPGQVKHTQATVEIPVFFSRQLSLSRLSAVSSRSESDPTIITCNPGMTDSDGSDQTGSPIYKDKKKTRRREKEKQSRYSPRADLKKKAKEHFSKPD